MKNHRRLLRNLFVSWFEGEMARLLKARKSTQIGCGTATKHNVGVLLQEVIDSSPFDFRLVPISVSPQTDLKAVALSKLVAYLPWDVLQHKLDFQRMRQMGFSVNAELERVSAHLLQVG